MLVPMLRDPRLQYFEVTGNLGSTAQHCTAKNCPQLAKADLCDLCDLCVHALRNAAAILSYQGPDTSNVMTVAWHFMAFWSQEGLQGSQIQSLFMHKISQKDIMSIMPCIPASA